MVGQGHLTASTGILAKEAAVNLEVARSAAYDSDAGVEWFPPINLWASSSNLKVCRKELVEIGDMILLEVYSAKLARDSILNSDAKKRLTVDLR